MLKRTFLNWWLIVLVEAAVFSFAAYKGYVTQIWDIDATHITTLVFVMFLWATYLIGKASYFVDVNPDGSEKTMEFGWFKAESFMLYGLIGSMVGLLNLLVILPTLLTGDPMTSMGNLAKEFGMSMCPMLVGAICTLALRYQVYNLQHTFEGE